MKNKIYIDRAEDRNTVASALVANGYTVRISRDKTKTGTRYLHYVEYWKED